jgi:hypothetical protein
VIVIDPPSLLAKVRPSDVRATRARRPPPTNPMDPCPPVGRVAGPRRRTGRVLGRPKLHALPRAVPLLIGRHQANTPEGAKTYCLIWPNVERIGWRNAERRSTPRYSRARDVSLAACRKRGRLPLGHG